MEASMTPGHRQWKKSILTGGALCAAWWPFPLALHLEQQHLPGTESVYFDLDNTPWVKCDKCHGEERAKVLFHLNLVLR